MTRQRSITIKADSSELRAFLKRLSPELVNLPEEFSKPALDFLKISTNLVSLESRTTSRAVVTILFKPSQRLLDFETAIRTGDFNLFAVEDSH